MDGKSCRRNHDQCQHDQTHTTGRPSRGIGTPDTSRAVMLLSHNVPEYRRSEVLDDTGGMWSGPSGQCGDRHPHTAPEVSKGLQEVVTSLRHAVTWLTGWLATQSVRGLRLSLGGVFLWFGVLKFFPD